MVFFGIWLGFVSHLGGCEKCEKCLPIADCNMLKIFKEIRYSNENLPYGNEQFHKFNVPYHRSQ